ncbi:hypothetical protein AFLA70_730g000310 [Aspergillus flavus AF70]|nr:hypothetical protein AFLA70_730g000310 [Aspergillus flavus AF70]
MYERQRVWRACQACRKRKIKCDGEQPCQSCCRNNAQCIYTDLSGNARLFDPKYIMSLESRIHSMEAQLRAPSPPRTSEPVHQPADDPAVLPANVDATDLVKLTMTNSEKPDQNQGDLPLDTLSSAPNMASLHTGSLAPARESPAEHQEGLLNSGTFVFKGDGQLGDGRESARSLTHLKPIPDEVRTLLVGHYFRVIHPIFPIIPEKDFREQLRRSGLGHDDDNSQLSFVMNALLAVAVSGLKSTHPISEDPCLRAYDLANLGHLFYSNATREILLFQSKEKLGLNSIIGHGLLSLYLAETGKAYEAWVTTGHAIRLYQGLDLSDDLIPSQDPHMQRGLWWCLYVLDRSLSTALLKPLAIDDTEYGLEDKFKAPTRDTDSETDFWFSVIVDFHIIMGRIYKTVRYIRKAARNSTPNLEDKIQADVRRHDAELGNYFTEKVLPWIKESPQDFEAIALQTVALSSYYASLILLHRVFLEKYTVAEPAMFLRCAEAASGCIKLTPRLIATVPGSHFLIQHGRALFASAKVLLHCIRLTWNPIFTAKALNDLEAAVGMLRNLSIQWPEIETYQTLVQEELKSIKAEFERRDKLSEALGRFGGGPSNITLCLDRLPDLDAHLLLPLSGTDLPRCHLRQQNHSHNSLFESTVQRSLPSTRIQHEGTGEPAAKRLRKGDDVHVDMGMMERPSMVQGRTSVAADEDNPLPITRINSQLPILSPGTGSLSAESAGNDFMAFLWTDFDLIENQ